MKKLIPVFLVCLMLAACNYPTDQLTSEEVVQTNVALILTNAPDTTLIPEVTLEAQTPEPTVVPAETDAAATQPQPIPTDTPEPMPSPTWLPRQQKRLWLAIPRLSLGNPTTLRISLLSADGRMRTTGS